MYEPSAVDVDKAQKMAVLERLEYAFNVAEKEFEVHPLLDPAGMVVSSGQTSKHCLPVIWKTCFSCYCTSHLFLLYKFFHQMLSKEKLTRKQC